MNVHAPAPVQRESSVLLGDEAVALGASHAGISAAYAYPGTPATEIEEFLLQHARGNDRPVITWCTNEKTAYEQALGVSLVGRRSLVSMKHVGLNVAADPFINSAIVSVNGGLVLAIADDPGMHSSQNEQDSRIYADFARVICLEPATQQEAYEMTREAFDLSERFHVPVVVRLVTRLAHSRTIVETEEPVTEPPLTRPDDANSWILLPVNARKQWRSLLERHQAMRAYTENCPHNKLSVDATNHELGVITTGIARGYYREGVSQLESKPAHLHIGAYPIPVEKVRRLADAVKTILVLEEGYPYLERYLRGILDTPVSIRGKLSGCVPLDGELTPDIVRDTLGVPPQPLAASHEIHLPNRPPQLCVGCPHGDTYASLKKALAGFDGGVVASDIGCYTLGALPPYSAIESCVCMGASVGMAKGASDAGSRPAVAVIGDSTFLHSGVTPLIDAVAADTDMTLLILDNEIIAMTGGQPTALPSESLKTLILGLGVKPEHCRAVDAHPKNIEQMTDVIRQEIEHHGLSVVISSRACLEAARMKKKKGLS